MKIVHYNRIIFILFCYSFCSAEAKLDKDIKLNSFNLELGGAGGFYSFNYDRLLPLNDNLALNFGVGISPQLLYGVANFTLMPASLTNIKLTYILRERKYILLGLSSSVFYGNHVVGFFDEYYVSLNTYFGYKYDCKNNKNYFTTSFSPWVNYENSFVFYPWLSFSYGYKFNKIERRKIHPKEDTAKIESLSASLGIVNYKFRLQYEKGHKTNSSNGAMLTFYFGDFPGLKLEGFTRQYRKKQSNSEGFFWQEKIGVGYLFSGMYDEHEENIAGITFGGGVAGGYKLMIGNHLNVEAILGLHYYVPPLVGAAAVAYGKDGQKYWWYTTTGMPIDFQFKIGWQY
jgi:hypothetical protein